MVELYAIVLEITWGTLLNSFPIFKKIYSSVSSYLDAPLWQHRDTIYYANSARRALERQLEIWPLTHHRICTVVHYGSLVKHGGKLGGHCNIHELWCHSFVKYCSVIGQFHKCFIHELIHKHIFPSHNSLRDLAKSWQMAAICGVAIMLFLKPNNKRFQSEDVSLL